MAEPKTAPQPEELSEEEMEKVTGGSGLRDVTVTKTKDIDDSIEGRA